MSDVAIHVENLGKRYRIGAGIQRHTSIREALVDAATAPFRNLKNLRRLSRFEIAEEADVIWALRDVSFEVKHGEVLGIVGRNGAGKSTLLKLLSRITDPTAGRVELKGRVGSLLEVGTGFHPELTGRENVYLNGSILGMDRAYIARRFDEIVEFSGVEKFVDTPVKRYSSGMYLRLAFAVAAHLEPEILIVDEVLAVGDAEFQKKCLGKMDQVSRQGRTVLFVSHNLGAVTRLCPRTIWLRAGTLEVDGPSGEVVTQYQMRTIQGSAEWVQSGRASGQDVAFSRVAVLNRDGLLVTAFCGDEPVSVEISYVVHRPLAGCQIAATIFTSDGTAVLTTADSDQAAVSTLPRIMGEHTARLTIPACLLAPGVYSVQMGAHLPGRSVYDLVDAAVTFEILPPGSLASLDSRPGVVAPLLEWNTEQAGDRIDRANLTVGVEV